MFTWIWIDSLENDYHLAQGYEVQGFVTDKDEANRITTEADKVIGDGWPLVKGREYPKLVWEEVTPYIEK
jgi:hypothetical protein